MSNKNFNFDCNITKAYIDEGGKMHVVGVASDNIEDKHRDTVTLECLKDLAMQGRQGTAEFLSSHKEAFAFGKVVDADVISPSTGVYELMFDAVLDDKYPQSKDLFNEVSNGVCEKQLSIGGDLDLSDLNAYELYYENGQKKRKLKKLRLDHITCTRKNRASNGRTRFVSAIYKSIDEGTEIDCTPVEKSIEDGRKSAFAVAFKNYPLKSRDKEGSWSITPQEKNRIISTFGWEEYKNIHAVCDPTVGMGSDNRKDPNTPEVRSAYSLPHHKIDNDGKIKTWYNGIVACASSLLPSRKFRTVVLPKEVRRDAYEHLARHMNEYGMISPVYKEFEEMKEVSDFVNFIIEKNGIDIDKEDIEKEIFQSQVRDKIDAESQNFSKIEKGLRKIDISNCVDNEFTPRMQTVEKEISEKELENIVEKRGWNELKKACLFVDCTVEKGDWADPLTPESIKCYKYPHHAMSEDSRNMEVCYTEVIKSINSILFVDKDITEACKKKSLIHLCKHLIEINKTSPQIEQLISLKNTDDLIAIFKECDQDITAICESIKAKENVVDSVVVEKEALASEIEEKRVLKGLKLLSKVGEFIEKSDSEKKIEEIVLEDQKTEPLKEDVVVENKESENSVAHETVPDSQDKSTEISSEGINKYAAEVVSVAKSTEDEDGEQRNMKTIEEIEKGLEEVRNAFESLKNGAGFDASATSGVKRVLGSFYGILGMVTLEKSDYDVLTQTKETIEKEYEEKTTNQAQEIGAKINSYLGEVLNKETITTILKDAIKEDSSIVEISKGVQGLGEILPVVQATSARLETLEKVSGVRQGNKITAAVEKTAPSKNSGNPFSGMFNKPVREALATFK